MAKGRKEIPTQRKTLLQHLRRSRPRTSCQLQHRRAVRPRRAARSSSSWPALPLHWRSLTVQELGWPRRARNGSETARWDICPAQRERSPQAQERSVPDAGRPGPPLVATCPCRSPPTTTNSTRTGGPTSARPCPTTTWGIPTRRPCSPCTPARRGPRTTLPRSRLGGTANPQPPGRVVVRVLWIRLEPDDCPSGPGVRQRLEGGGDG